MAWQWRHGGVAGEQRRGNADEMAVRGATSSPAQSASV